MLAYAGPPPRPTKYPVGCTLFCYGRDPVSKVIGFVDPIRVAGKGQEGFSKCLPEGWRADEDLSADPAWKNYCTETFKHTGRCNPYCWAGDGR